MVVWSGPGVETSCLITTISAVFCGTKHSDSLSVLLASKCSVRSFVLYCGTAFVCSLISQKEIIVHY